MSHGYLCKKEKLRNKLKNKSTDLTAMVAALRLCFELNANISMLTMTVLTGCCQPDVMITMFTILKGYISIVEVELYEVLSLLGEGG